MSNLRWDRVQNWTESLKQLFFTIVDTRIAETLALYFLVTTATLTYYYGTYLVLPVVIADYPSAVKVSTWILTTWIYVAICSNLYLVRKRHSSIRTRMLIMQPVAKPMTSPSYSMDSDAQVRETAKHMSQHLTPDPCGEGHNWHICGTCEVFVPPRCWHCHTCNTCILRRDHHCIFTGCCIGEENQCNFMGLTFYLGCGTSISALFSFIYAVYYQEMGVWWYLLRQLGLFYSVITIDFEITFILASMSTIGQMSSWAVFFYYFYISLKGQTSADAHRKICRTLPDEKKVSFKNMKEFLGENPILRILWPFYPPFRVDYSPISRVMDTDRNHFLFTSAIVEFFVVVRAAIHSPYKIDYPSSVDEVLEFEEWRPYSPSVANY